MTKLVTLTCVFIMIIYLKNAVNLASEIEEKRKEKDDKYSKLWFGPRIGRRKRNPNEEIGSFDNNDVQNLVDFIRKNPWTIFVLSTGKFISLTSYFLIGCYCVF